MSIYLVPRAWTSGTVLDSRGSRETSCADNYLGGLLWSPQLTLRAWSGFCPPVQPLTLRVLCTLCALAHVTFAFLLTLLSISPTPINFFIPHVLSCLLPTDLSSSGTSHVLWLKPEWHQDSVAFRRSLQLLGQPLGSMTGSRL